MFEIMNENDKKGNDFKEIVEKMLRAHYEQKAYLDIYRYVRMVS